MRLYMVPNDLSPSLLTLYSDLVQQLSSAPPAGSVYTRERDGIEYMYAKIPVGASRIDSFIGRADDPIAMEQARALALGMELAKTRRRLVSMLKSGGLAGPDSMLGGTLDAIAHAGLFKNGAVLVGTAAYMMLEPHVGRRLPAPTLMTGDLDLATLNVALSADPPESIEAVLRRADPTFEAVLQLDPRQPAARYRNSAGYIVDLLTQTRKSGQRAVRLPKLRAAAEPLQHLAWLVESPVSAVALWGAGVAVQVPQPARFAVHKLIVAQRRGPTDRLKRQKDLAQADAIMAALYANDPFALEDVLENARSRGPSWRQAVERSLAELARKT